MLAVRVGQVLLSALLLGLVATPPAPDRTLAASGEACGTLETSTTFSGSVTVTCDVYVPAGLTLTVSPGATVSFQETRPYVDSVEAVAGNRVGLFQPEIQEAATGIDLYITPTISEDKRYVILNIDVSQTTVLDIIPFPFNIAGPAPETSAAEDGTIETLGSTASTGVLQQPVTQENTVITRVKVPDGGTLLLGGQKVVGEVEREMGVPALNKIPLINRLFSNKSMVKDESVLLILIKPKVILQEEEEDIRFGGLTTGN